MQKKMTAFRWAKEHNIPLYKYEHGTEITLESINNKISITFKEANRVSSTTDSGYYVSSDRLSYKESLIIISPSSSQGRKEAIVWHEIGHYINKRQVGRPNKVLLEEALASKNAIRLMKKYGRYKESYKEYLLKCYKVYEESQFSTVKSFRHLIENA